MWKKTETHIVKKGLSKFSFGIFFLTFGRERNGKTRGRHRVFLANLGFRISTRQAETIAISFSVQKIVSQTNEPVWTTSVEFSNNRCCLKPIRIKPRSRFSLRIKRHRYFLLGSTDFRIKLKNATFYHSQIFIFIVENIYQTVFLEASYFNLREICKSDCLLKNHPQHNSKMKIVVLLKIYQVCKNFFVDIDVQDLKINDRLQ